MDGKEKFGNTEIHSSEIRRNRMLKFLIFLVLLIGLGASFYFVSSKGTYQILGWIVASIGTYLLPIVLSTFSGRFRTFINSKNGGIFLIAFFLGMNILNIFISIVIGAVLFLILGYWLLRLIFNIVAVFAPTQ